MATEKTRTVTEEQGKMDMNELVSIKLSKTREKQDDVFVSLNGKNLKIQRGVQVEVPRWAFEILENSERMDEESLNRQTQASKLFA